VPLAGGGTLLLEDVDRLSVAQQQRLLKALGRAEGSCRLVATLSSDPAAEVQAGRLSKGLFALLTRRRVLVTPALRERAEDLPLLLEYFLAQEARRAGTPRCSLSPDDRHAIVARLSSYSWPGNVRELRDLVRLLVDSAPEREIRLADVPRPEEVAVRQVFKVMDRIEITEVPVLIAGGTDVDRELLARCVHGRSPRAARPFVHVDCAALGDGDAEQQLFDAGGVFRRAHGGTLYLDGVEDLSPGLQRLLLRVKQGVVPLTRGGSAWINVRVISATRCADLRGRARRGVFRQDLFYRLNVVSLQLPASSTPSAAIVERVLAQGAVSTAALELLPRVFAETYDVCPLLVRGQELVVATASESPTALDDLRFMLNTEIVDLRCASAPIRGAIGRIYPPPREPHRRRRSRAALRAVPAQPALLAVPATPPLRAIPAGPVLRAEPVLRAIPVAAAPLPAASPPLPAVLPVIRARGWETLSAGRGRHDPRAWFTREGWHASVTGAIVYVLVTSAAMAYWSCYPGF
jgi:transcriptional regulator with AAA-type ATPase domain